MRKSICSSFKPAQVLSRKHGKNTFDLPQLVSFVDLVWLTAELKRHKLVFFIDATCEENISCQPESNFVHIVSSKIFFTKCLSKLHQYLHWQGFPPVWACMCFFNLFPPENVLAHSSPAEGLSPVMYNFKLFQHKKTFSQHLHLSALSSVWFLKWVFVLFPVLNVSTHYKHENILGQFLVNLPFDLQVNLHVQHHDCLQFHDHLFDHHHH